MSLQRSLNYEAENDKLATFKNMKHVDNEGYQDGDD